MPNRGYTGFSNYKKVIENKYSSIKVIGDIGAEKDVFKFDINDMYIPLRISVDERIAICKKGYERKETIEAGILLKENIKKIVVRGGPGMGKTTMLEYLMGIANRDDSIVPVYIKLSEFSRSGKSLLDYIIKSIQEIDMSIEDTTIMNKLSNGGILVLLDALDEVKKGTNGQSKGLYYIVLDEIEKFSANYSKCKIILTSRKHGFEAVDFS